MTTYIKVEKIAKIVNNIIYKNLRNHWTWTKEITVDNILKQPSFVYIPYSFIHLIERHLHRT